MTEPAPTENLTSEAEAAHSWCPFARIVSREGGNRPQSDTDDYVASEIEAATRCLASCCMAWRTVKQIDGRWYGYCGLAGPR